MPEQKDFHLPKIPLDKTWKIDNKATYALKPNVPGSSPVGNKEAPSANILIFGFRSVPKSFMYIRKKNGPKIDPCGTPARIHIQSDAFPLRVTP